MSTKRRKRLFHKLFTSAGTYIDTNCRKLESVRYSYLFGDGSNTSIIEELARFQNEDGGFGQGLEPDFALPSSSPIATSIGLQICDEASVPSDLEMVKRALEYLHGTLSRDEAMWIPVPNEVNDYPHAPWWHYDGEKTEIQRKEQWGNPSAELTGWLVRYGEAQKSPTINSLVEKTVVYVVDHDIEIEPHELYCLLRFYRNVIPSGLIGVERVSELQKKLREMVNKAVCRDPKQWIRYVPQPVDFVTTPSSYLLADLNDSVEQNLDFLVDSVTPDGVWLPAWKWSGYEEAWQRAAEHWTGMLTLKNLKILKAFDRIDSA